MRIKTTFTGFDAAARKSIASLDPKAKAGAKRGVAKANKIALAAMKSSLTRSLTGLLRKSLGSKVKVSGNIVYGVIGPRLGFRTTITSVERKSRGLVFTGFRGRKGKPNLKTIKLRPSGSLNIGQVLDPGKEGRLIEKGHQRGAGKSAAPAYPFVKPARDATASQIVSIITAEISAAVHGQGSST